MNTKKIKVKLFISLTAIIILLLLILLLIHIYSSQTESTAEQVELQEQETPVPEKETEQEEIKQEIEEEKPAAQEQETVITQEKSEVPQEKIIMFDVDATKNWQDSGVVVIPEKHITIAYEKGKWTIDYNRHNYVGVEGYPGINSRSDYPSITFGALIGKIGQGKAFKVGKYYEINKSQIIGNLYFKMNDLSVVMNDNKGSITVKISIQ